MTKMSEGPQTKNRLKEFGLTTLSVNNSTSIFLLAIMIFILGTLAYIRMPKRNNFRKLPLPTVYINTPYFGNSKVKLKNLVTKTFGETNRKYQRYKIKFNFYSRLFCDYCRIWSWFGHWLSFVKLKDTVDKAKQDLPTDLTEGTIGFGNKFSDIPIVTINIFEIIQWFKRYARRPSG